MRSKILFFGATADAVGARELEVEIDEDLDVNAVLETLEKAHPKLLSYNLLVAINEEYVAGDARLKNGDELAIFTAVSGG
jgi:molybdopterin converting factor small subunit